MNEPNYEFIDDVVGGILKIVIRNHWDLATTERFHAEVKERVSAIARNRAGRRQYLLIDASKHGVQSQEVTRELSRGMAENIFHRTAIVVSGALQNMQARRVRSANDDHRICTSEKEALAWLRAGVESPADAV